MSESWDDIAPGWDDNPSVQTYADRALASLLNAADQHGFSVQGRILDFGCGTGALTQRLVQQAAHIHGVDKSVGMLDVLREKVAAHGWPHVTTGTALSNVDEPGYDLVVCSSVLGFFERESAYPAIVHALGARLLPGGVLVQWDWQQSPGDDHGLTAEHIKDAFTRASLTTLEVGQRFEMSSEHGSFPVLMGVARR